MSDANASPSFEAILERLEAISAQLERGDAALEESLALFEEGIRLARMGTQRLDDAEGRLEVLLQDNSLAPMETASSTDEAADESTE